MDYPNRFKRGHIPWNKGIKTGNVPRSAFKEDHVPWNKGTHGLAPPPWNKGKKGLRISPKTEFKKGHIPWNKGLTKETDEALKRISENEKGKHRSRRTEFKEGHSIYFSGWKKFSKKHKEKISEALRGKLNPDHSERMKKLWRKKEYKERQIKAHIGLRAWNKGEKLSETHIRKILLKRIPSSLEEDFQKIISKHNLPYAYVGDGSFFIERHNPDFINIDGEKIAIEVYSEYYKLKNHKSIEQWKRKRQKVFNKYGWILLFFDETQVKENQVLATLGQ